MRLNRTDKGRGPALTFLHGFTQTGASWDPVVDKLVDRYSCAMIDAPGHGRSPDGARSLESCADDVFETMDPSVLVGYSMGARMALTTALRHCPTDRITGLVLVSGTPGIYDEAERSARRTSDNELADRIERIGVAAFIDEWLALPMFSGLSDATAQRSLRLANSASGLADSLRHAGTGTQRPASDDDLKRIDVPVLLVTGALDAKFTLIAEQTQPRIQRCDHVIVEGVGHTVHLEAPTTFVEILDDWLSGIQRGH